MQLDELKNTILSLEELKVLSALWKSRGEKIVFTNGCFDLIHQGHIDYLSKSRALGNRLIVAVNSDDSVRRLDKGPSRPIKDEETRMMIMASFRFVDAVVRFNEDTPFELIKMIQPDVLVKGGDYDPLETDPESKSYIVGSDIVRNSGGEVVVLPFLPGHSTTNLENRIKNSN
jgi:rfaE bifunctional protein nucleotidyltransferase chain/domain